MATEIKVPPLGESIVEATVGRWLKREGEEVTEGEPVVELETEKVNMEVTANGSGVLGEIVKQEGETVNIGDTLAVIASAADARQPVPTRPARQRPQPEPQPSTQPAAPPTQPASPSPAPAPAVATQPPTQPATQAPNQDAVRATPLARRMAEEYGVDLTRVRGTGPVGRVTHDDVSAYLGAANANGASAPAQSQGQSQTPPLSAVPPQQPIPTPAPAGPTMPATALTPFGQPAAPSAFSYTATRGEERIRMSRRRQTIARRLVEAQHTAAMLTTFNEVDMSAVMELRKRRRDAFKERHGVGLGFMSFFTKAVIGALKQYPRLNAEIQGDEIVLKHYYDIGIAVSTDEGLVVPVIRDADRLSFAAIERDIAELAEKARDRRLSLEDLQGGTFTITNGGVFGSLLSTPILNGPQVGILGMHKIEERPIALNGQVVIHPMMYLAASYDHRIVDGAEAVGFLVRIKELLEDPETLLLEG
ncbi:MAG TPA: 2-oxoglutarate dehydrogenase complex dihydrolipoyllysine-residue succinyltransferase [Ktedonobacterales bacterium]